jgi:CHAD domain-containing protein
MPLDVPACAFALPEGVDPGALVSFLGERFDLAVDPPERTDHTVLDTADRRLRAAGAELRLHTRRGEPTMVLVGRPGAPPLTATVRHQRRWLAGDLPEGPLRDRVAPTIGVRALLPLARVRGEVRPARVLNRDDKTVVRLRLATHAAVVDGGEVPLTPRLEVAGVLGYRRPFERLVSLLTAEAGLVEAPGVADEAIAAAGGDPDGVPSKVRVPLRPDQRTDEAAVAVLRALAGVVEANLPGTLDDLDTEFLHDLRVAVRRSRSVLREMKRAFPPGPLRRQRDALRWLQAVTGPTRDLDVQLLEWDDLVATLPEDRQAALAPVRALLERRRRDAHRALRRELTGEAYGAAWGGYRRFLDGDLGPDDERPDAAAPVVAVAGRRIRKVYRRMVAMGEAVDAGSPATALHELRKRGKELRYLLELFGGLWPGDEARDMVRALKALQDVLGTHQDREVQADALRALAPDLAGVEGGPDALLALGAVVERLGTEQRAARERFADRFAEFASPSRQALVAETFRP